MPESVTQRVQKRRDVLRAAVLRQAMSIRRERIGATIGQIDAAAMVAERGRWLYFSISPDSRGV